MILRPRDLLVLAPNSYATQPGNALADSLRIPSIVLRPTTAGGYTFVALALTPWPSHPYEPGEMQTFMVF